MRDAEIEIVAAVGPPACAIITDGRVWHGTGANISASNRYAMILTLCGPQYKPEKNYTIGTRRDVYAQLSAQTRARLGFKD